MGRFVVFAIGGAGGDLPPLVGASLALRDRDHQIFFLGDRPVERTLASVGVQTRVLPEGLELGPRLSGAIRASMETTGGDLEAAGPLVEEAMASWAREAASAVSPVIDELRPDAVVTSLFGVEVLEQAAPPCPWAVVNSTFYIGPNPPRPIEQDIGPRAIPLVRRYARLLRSPDLVLHATDQIFDFSFDGLPAHHHYTGPLGVWEPLDVPDYLDEPGDPWVLVSISSQLQDDVPLAEAALAALSDKPVRVVVSVGPDHDPGEISIRPANAHLERTLPHSSVLKRGVLLVSHAGHGSVMKALWEGRPMVLMPWGRDQPGVGARAEALGVAELVRRGDDAEAELAASIERTLGSATMRARAEQHAARLDVTDPPIVAASLLESLV